MLQSKEDNPAIEFSQAIQKLLSNRNTISPKQQTLALGLPHLNKYIHSQLFYPHTF